MLNIAKHIQVGWDSKESTIAGLHEADIIPIGKSANEKKKIVAITKYNDVLKEYENIPLPGFTLLKADRKSFGSLDKTWLIIDPRGFLSRITSENLEKILHVTGITEGLIQEKCVWAREDSQTTLTLIPVTSEDYLTAVQNTELIESKIDTKLIQIGDTVLTQSGMTGVYMGSLSLYGPMISSYDEYKPQIFLRRQIIKVADKQYVYQSDAKILQVTNKTTNPKTREESANEINLDIKNNAEFSTINNFSHTHYSVRGKVCLVSVNAVPKLPMSFIEITKDEATKLFVEGFNECDIGKMILQDDKGFKFLIEHPQSSYAKTRSTCDVNSFEVHCVDTDLTTSYSIINSKSQKNDWIYKRINPNKSVKSIDNFVKFYKIVKHVKSDTYI